MRPPRPLTLIHLLSPLAGRRSHDLSLSTLSDKLTYEDDRVASPGARLPPRPRTWAAPFALKVDGVRAVLHGFQAFISFTLMLVAMTFNFWCVPLAVLLCSSIIVLRPVSRG